VLQDREGSIWLGLAGHGLAKWRGYRRWEGFTTESGLGSELISSPDSHEYFRPVWFHSGIAG
jgi:hypothetical protein